MAADKLKWIFLGCLSLVWGSSFILIKKALLGMSALQVGSLRILFAAGFLIVVGWKSLGKIRSGRWKWILLSGLLGTFFPAYLFSFAETEIGSAVVSILNSTTPLLSMLSGILLFGASFIRQKFLGVVVGLVGTIALILSGAALHPAQNYWYALLVILASLFYGINANIIKTKLHDLPALSITTGNFMVLILPALLVLVGSGFFSPDLPNDPQFEIGLLAVGVLGVLGTGAALILFNQLIKISDPVFATSVTYIVPVVALMWGILDGESFTWLQFLAGAVIILGVLLVNRKRKKA